MSGKRCSGAAVLGLVIVPALVSCDPSTPTVPSRSRPSPGAIEAPGGTLAPLIPATRTRVPLRLPLERRLAPVGACVAPSLMQHAPRDRLDAVPDCAALGPIVGGTDPRSCAAVRPEGGLARIEEAVPIIDGATEERILEIAHRGRERGRNQRAFGMVGDSITEGLLFLGPFAEGSSQPVETSREVQVGLATTLDGRAATIVDVYRGVPVEPLPGFVRDSFRATRAAKVGASSSWGLAPGRDGRSPLTAMIERVNPAVAIVMFGSNDAAAGLVPIDELTSRFEGNLRRMVRELDEAGIVPILSTVPRRGPQPGLRDCAPDGLSDARVMVQTSAVSAAAARVACAERLPLIDLRYAFDGLVGAGLFSDGIHPTSHPRGSGLLTDEGLGCGYNVRNYLALRALREVRQIWIAQAP